MTVSINVLNYNAFLRPYPEFKEAQHERATKMADALLGLNPNLDVVIFSGVHDENCRHILLDNFESHGFFHSTPVVGGLVQEVPKKKKKFIFTNGGMFVISKHPIEIVKTNCMTNDKSASSRGITYTAIRKDKFRFHLFGAHMCDWGDDQLARRNESKYIKQFIQQMHIPISEPVIIGGHMNCDYLQQIDRINEIVDHLNTSIPDIAEDSFRATYSSDNTLVGYDGMKPPFHDRWLDYFMISNEYMQPISSDMKCIRPKPEEAFIEETNCCIPCRSKIFRDFSCHYPVLMTISFNH